MGFYGFFVVFAGVIFIFVFSQGLAVEDVRVWREVRYFSCVV